MYGVVKLELPTPEMFAAEGIEPEDLFAILEQLLDVSIGGLVNAGPVLCAKADCAGRNAIGSDSANPVTRAMQKKFVFLSIGPFLIAPQPHALRSTWFD